MHISITWPQWVNRQAIFWNNDNQVHKHIEWIMSTSQVLRNEWKCKYVLYVFSKKFSWPWVKMLSFWVHHCPFNLEKKKKEVGESVMKSRVITLPFKYLYLKWPRFCRWHFLLHFSDWKSLHFDWNLFLRVQFSKVCIGSWSCDGKAPQRQAFTWTNDVPVCLIYVLPVLIL